MSEQVKKIGDIRGPKALDVFAELLPLIFKMADDEEAQEYFTSGQDIKLAQRLEKLISIVNRHKDTFFAIEAAKRGITSIQCEENMSIDDIFSASTELMTDPLFRCFFGLARKDKTLLTPAPGSIEEA